MQEFRAMSRCLTTSQVPKCATTNENTSIKILYRPCQLAELCANRCDILGEYIFKLLYTLERKNSVNEVRHSDYLFDILYTYSLYLTIRWQSLWGKTRASCGPTPKLSITMRSRNKSSLMWPRDAGYSKAISTVVGTRNRVPGTIAIYYITNFRAISY